MTTTQVQSHGIGFMGMLTILFIGLKLTGFVDWSWLMVLFPLWFPFALYISIFVIFFILTWL